MKKIPSIFLRDFDGNPSLVKDVPDPAATWVFLGEGVPTRKFDGTCCLVRGGKLYKRLDCKRGKTPPTNFEPCGPADPVTGHHVGWVPVGDEPDSRWHREAFAAQPNLPDGTYELCGPKLQGNPEGQVAHVLIPHGVEKLADVPRGFDALKEFLRERPIEGIVWHHPDGRMAKIKRTDFGWPWPISSIKPKEQRT